MPDSVLSAVRRRPLLSVALGLLIVDQLSKFWAVSALSGHVDNLLGPLQLQLMYDPSSTISRIPRTSWLLTVALVSLVVVVPFVARHTRFRSSNIAFGLAIGGILGNFADTFTHHPHGVVNLFVLNEFINFNVSDAAIVVGVTWIALGLLSRVARRRPLVCPAPG